MARKGLKNSSGILNKFTSSRHSPALPKTLEYVFYIGCLGKERESTYITKNTNPKLKRSVNKTGKPEED